MSAVKFDNITHATVNHFLFLHSVERNYILPPWEAFEVTVRTPEDSAPVVEIFEGYSFEITENGAYDIIASLRNVARC